MGSSGKPVPPYMTASQARQHMQQAQLAAAQAHAANRLANMQQTYGNIGGSYRIAMSDLDTSFFHGEPFHDWLLWAVFISYQPKPDTKTFSAMLFELADLRYEDRDKWTAFQAAQRILGTISKT